jgi:hypothetical protein
MRKNGLVEKCSSDFALLRAEDIGTCSVFSIARRFGIAIQMSASVRATPDKAISPNLTMAGPRAGHPAAARSTYAKASADKGIVLTRSSFFGEGGLRGE